MLKKLVASGMIAGVAAGLIATLLQLALVLPLILQAELYENGTLVHVAQAAPDHHAEPDSAAESPQEATPKPAETAGFNLERNALTLLSNIAAFGGFGLLLVAAFGLAQGQGIAVSARMGALWGLGGFAAFQIATGAGLPPELPGNFAADLQARQIWWLSAALLSAAGIYTLAYMRSLSGIALGALLIALPHLYGAPHPQGYGGVVPPELMALYVARAYAVGAVAWLVLGTVAGMVWARIQSQEA